MKMMMNMQIHRIKPFSNPLLLICVREIRMKKAKVMTPETKRMVYDTSL